MFGFRIFAAIVETRKHPLLGKGGVAAHQEKYSLPLNGADGVVRSTFRLLVA
jgi:hypothetical protein